MKRILLSCVLVLAGATWSFGAQIVINFSEATSLHTSVFHQMPNSNLGAHDLSPNTYQIVGVNGNGLDYDSLFYFDASALAGATIDCATFTIKDASWNINMENIELRRINTPAMWTQGDGTRNAPPGRFNRHNGPGIWYANLDNITAQGVDWKGNTTSYGAHDASAEWASAVGDLIETRTLAGEAAWTTYVITSLVQQWASGTWQNKGFTLYGQNATAGANLELINPSVTIDYTAAVPEPGTMALIGTGTLGLVAFLRRRRMK